MEDIIDQFENGVAELKKGFFRSDEQEQELSYEKKELREAKKALSEVEQEMEENRHCRINIALAETDDEGASVVLFSRVKSSWIETEAVSAAKLLSLPLLEKARADSIQ